MYYGQFDPPTDLLIERYFAENYVGSCVEVGAVDGLHLSNTLHFEDAGWKCLCIEPNEYYHEALRRRRKLVLPYAVSNQNQDAVILHRVKIGDTFDACTSLKPDAKLINQFGNMVTSQDKTVVNARTLDSCLAEVGWTSVDFVSIDTEGTELDVLRGFTLNQWKPKLLILENNYGTGEVSNYLKSHGYRNVLRHQVNDFYLRVI